VSKTSDPISSHFVFPDFYARSVHCTKCLVFFFHTTNFKLTFTLYKLSFFEVGLKLLLIAYSF
jgi:hypothetical protein